MVAGRAEKDGEDVVARILYWGAEGSGKSTNLRTIHAKLRADNRGDLSEVPTRLDPTVCYEVLPIELGEVQGSRTRLEIVAVPGAPEQAPTRKQLLDRVDGVVLVVDSQSDRVEANVASFQELRQALGAYGRSLESLPVVVQYNKHDLSDPVPLEDLHRKLELPGAAVFEAVATEPGGPLRTLTTISKRVMRVLREQAAGGRLESPQPPPQAEPAAATAPAQPVAPPAPTPAAAPPVASRASTLMEQAILAEAAEDSESEAAAAAALDAQAALDRPWPELEQEAKESGRLRFGADLRIVSVGQASAVDRRSLRVPLVLGNDDGETVSFALTLQLDPLLDGEEP